MTTKNMTIKELTIKKPAFRQLSKQSKLAGLPTLLTVGVLSTGLLLSGCSDHDTVEAAAVDTSETETTENQTTVKETKGIDGGLKNTDDAKTNTAQKNIAQKNSETVTKDINPIAAAVKEPSILTNKTQAGTPEHTVKLALDTLYYGDVEKAATYYKVDMKNFAEELKNTQFAFQQTVESVTIIDTKYNDDKTKATVTGELMLKGQSEPAPLSYELQKIDNAWKILG